MTEVKDTPRLSFRQMFDGLPGSWAPDNPGGGPLLACDACVFWRAHAPLDEPGSLGECRYNPAQWTGPERGRPAHIWPVTWAKDWCGRFEQSPEAAAEFWDLQRMPG